MINREVGGINKRMWFVMKKFKRFIIYGMIALLLSYSSMFGCVLHGKKFSCAIYENKQQDEEKYDVEIMVIGSMYASSEEEQYIFTLDTDVINIEKEYTGIGVSYHAEKYRYLKDGVWSKWYDEGSSGIDDFGGSFTYRNEEGELVSTTVGYRCKERGTYWISFHSASWSMFKYRSITINLIIK